MPRDRPLDSSRTSSPTGRGGAGTYIEGELGAFYLLALLADIEPRGLPGARALRVRYQGEDEGFALDDLIIYGTSHTGQRLLEIQSKRTISFSPKDPVFADVCRQVVRTAHQGVPEERHRLSVATQRTSRVISGAYQDVLEWARKAEDGSGFFKRLAAEGVSGAEMRAFAETFRRNLVAAGASDDDDTIWRLVRRFLILEFDFESSASQARTHGLYVAQQTLAPEQQGLAEALWSNLIEVSIEKAKAGGFIERDELRSLIVERGFCLAGERNFSVARLKLAERTHQALAEIGHTIAGVQLPRLKAVEALDLALEHHRFVALRGGPGVGKSAVLKHIAERLAAQANVLVLDPVSTPDGGWPALAQTLDLQATARELLIDLAASGGGTIFIDSLEMFTSLGKRRTINDLLREVAAVDGVSVVVTTRLDFGSDGDDWLAPELPLLLGPVQTVEVGELDDDEIEVLRTQAPALQALLTPGHAAAAIVRNLYRLSRLLKVPSATTIRSEAALARHWWQTADSVQSTDCRAAQRLMARLADSALVGRDSIEVQDDSPARDHLLRSQTLSEPQRDHLRFYHDVLRDWAVGAYLHEDPERVGLVQLRAPASAKVARGFELAGRFALELNSDCTQWLALLEKVSIDGSHSSWRRQVLLAIVRSELSADLLERCSAVLLADDGALLVEEIAAVIAVETISPDDIPGNLSCEAAAWAASLPRGLRVASTPSAVRLVLWCVRHSKEIPNDAIAGVVKLVETLFLLLTCAPTLAGPTAAMLFVWLRHLDERDSEVLPHRRGGWRTNRRTTISELRSMCLLLGAHAPDELKAYLRAIAKENDGYKFKQIRPFSAAVAPVAPQELADLVVVSLIKPLERRSQRARERDQAFSFHDSDFLPPSPAQAPFLDLLEAAPIVGLQLVHKLVEEAVAFRTDGERADGDEFELGFSGGSRRFPWTQTYFWSRDQAPEYSVGSALMALEAWGHRRIEAGEPLDGVIADVLGPHGSCAAYLLVAVDLLLSNWPASRDLLVPFVASPHLLATERGRASHDRLATAMFGTSTEPAGRVRLSDLYAKPSRSMALENILPAYTGDDDASQTVRALLAGAVMEAGPYSTEADFGDPAFMGAHALNVLDAHNWVVVDQRREYRPPASEAEHLARLEQNYSQRRQSIDVESKIQLAINDPTRDTVALAREAVALANNELPDDTGSDVLQSKSTRLAATAMLIARAGDDALLNEHEQWVRNVIALTLSRAGDDLRTSSSALAYNPQALAIVALIHLWRRRRLDADRETIIDSVRRKDLSAIPAFSASLDVIGRTDPRVLKSAARLSFTSSRWRYRSWGEDEALAATYEREKAAADRHAFEAEVAWLCGGAEPMWPPFPEEKPSLRRHTRVKATRTTEGSKGEGTEAFAAQRIAKVHVETQTVALWLELLAQSAEAESWRAEIVDAYAIWSAEINGAGLPNDAEVDRKPGKWNAIFYKLVAEELMDTEYGRFDLLLTQVERFPDRSFGSVSEVVLLASDVLYFNSNSRSPQRAAELRKRLVDRTLKMRYWNREPRPGELSIDMDTGGIVARLLLNTHDVFGGTKSYLVPAVFDRVDPILDVLRPLLKSGPTPFIAMCTMNTLSVAPRARHLDFVLDAAEAWLVRHPTDTAMWIELGIGSRIVEWLSAAAAQDSSILGLDHPMRGRIDIVIGELVRLAVPGSYEFEKRVEQ